MIAQNSVASALDFPQDIAGRINMRKYRQFLEQACKCNIIEKTVISLPIFYDDLLKWLDYYRGQSSFNYYWQKPSSATSIAATGINTQLTAAGSHRFTDMKHLIDDAKNKILSINLTSGKESKHVYFMGGFSFFDTMKEPAWKGFKPAAFTLPECTLHTHKNATTLSIALSITNETTPATLHQNILDKIKHYSVALNSKGDGFLSSTARIEPSDGSEKLTNGYAAWIQTVKDAKQKMTHSNLQKVVLARQLNIKIHESYNPITALHHLRSHYPHCYSFLIQTEHSRVFIGSSPEQLISIKNGTIHTDALAGSIGRGKTNKMDKQLEQELLDSIKDQREHAYVVQGIDKLITPFVDSLKTTDKPTIKKLANVQHLHSPIQGTLKKGANLFSLLEKLHPTPAVGGTPRNKALQYIHQKELFNRGWFASPLGWINTQGNAEFTVAIRSGLIDKKTAHLFAGCGIVPDSNPETEWQETNLKLMPMLSALNYD